MRATWSSLLWVVAMPFLGCAGHAGSADGNQIDGDADGGDEPSTPFVLVFEDGAQACAQFADNRTAAQELALRGRIRFRPGMVVLPRDVELLQADLVSGVEVTGPNPVAAVPARPGEIVHRKEVALWGYCHHYRFTQSFLAGARPLAIEARFSFCFKNGVPDPQELVFDADNPGQLPKGLVEEQQVEILGLLDLGEDYSTEKQFYRSCTHADLPRYLVTVDLSGGGLIVLHKRLLKPLMGSGPATITRAEVSLDGQQAMVENYFLMAYAADLHNYHERYLVVFGSPVGAVYGLHLAETNQNDPPVMVQLLDYQLDPDNPLEQRAVEGYSEVEQ